MRSTVWRSTGIVIACLLVLAATAGAQDKTVPKSLVKFAQQTLATYGQDAQLVALVQKSNANPQDVAKLKAMDAKWQKNDNVADLMKSVLGSAAAQRLAKLIGSHPYVPEAFVMNAQGTIIGETNQTSTYWKGEQEKFTAAYADGKGALWFGKLAYDESTKTNSVQVSVPVMAGGKAIGAICFTVDVDAWEKR